MNPIKPSNNQIVPQDIQHQLIAIRDSQTKQYFLIGDIASLLIQQFQETYEAQEIQAAVGYYVGKSARTVRYYQSISEKIHADMREEFEPYGLSWAHFAVASRHPGRELEVLGWAVANLASVDRLKEHFRQDEPPAQEPEPVARFEYHTVKELLEGFSRHTLRLLTLSPGKQARLRALLGEMETLLEA